MGFDLNIQNYTTMELMEIFELPSNFDKNILEKKEAKLVENIMNNKQINKETKVQTIDFITKAKNIILNDIIHPIISDIQADLQKKAIPLVAELQKKAEPFVETIQERAERMFRSFGGTTDLIKTNLEDSSDHMVQIKESELSAPANPVEFARGIINPIKKKFMRKSLNIDSRFRDNYYSTASTNFNVNLPLTIENILIMQLNAIQLPMTFYTITRQYGNNFFTIKVGMKDATSATTVINIPNGNYIQTAIMDIINVQLKSAGPPFAFIKFQVNLTGTLTGVHTGTGQTMVGTDSTVPGSDTVSYIELNFQADRNGLEDRSTPLPLKFGWALGFRNGIYTGNLNYVSEAVVDLSGPKYLFLVVDDYNNNVNNNFFSAFNSSILNKNILARISLPLPNFFLLNNDTYMLTTLPREYFGPINLQTMNIQLLDEYGRIVDLSNMDFSFCLTLITIYDV
jgi:hypothetical protein